MVRIITDSTCDLPQSFAKQMGIDILPLTVLFGDQGYLDGIEISTEEFYQKLAQNSNLPTTSQINPDGFEPLFKQYIDAGDEIVGIFLSSHLSGTCQSAHIAKQTIGSDDIHIIDSLTVSFGMALLIRHALSLRDQGKNAQEITDAILAMIPKTKLFAMVDTLKYLKMGGRLSTMQAVMGGMLGIKPIVAIEDGKVISFGKARGTNGAFEVLQQLLKQFPPNKAYPISFGHAQAPQGLQNLMDFLAQDFELGEVETCEIGSVVGTHGGPGCIGFAYIAK